MKKFLKISEIITKLRHLFPADDFIHCVEWPVLGQLELLDEERLLDMVDADHLRVTSGKYARTVRGITQGREKSFSLLKILSCLNWINS